MTLPEPTQADVERARAIVKRFYPEMKPDYSGRRVQIVLAAIASITPAPGEVDQPLDQPVADRIWLTNGGDGLLWSEDLEEGQVGVPYTRDHRLAFSQAGEVAIPRAIAEQVLSMGRVEWGATAEQTADGHIADFTETLRLTREHFNYEDVPVRLHGLYLAGTETVLCHTGTSPNSPANAQALAGAWNWLVDQCERATNKSTELSDNLPHDGEGGECPVPHCTRISNHDGACATYPTTDEGDGK